VIKLFCVVDQEIRQAERRNDGICWSYHDKGKKWLTRCIFN